MFLVRKVSLNGNFLENFPYTFPEQMKEQINKKGQEDPVLSQHSQMSTTIHLNNKQDKKNILTCKF